MSMKPYCVTLHVDFSILSSSPAAAMDEVIEKLQDLAPDVLIGDLGHHAEVWEERPDGSFVGEVIVPIEKDLATYGFSKPDWDRYLKDQKDPRP